MNAKQIEATTQVPILAAGSRKFPDMIVWVDSKPLVLLEVKVHASVQEHRVPGSQAERPLEDGDNEVAFQSQLKTYSEWIGSQSTDDWPGAVVFLTHRTRAPEGFEDDGEGKGSTSVIHVTRTWRDVGAWLGNNLDLNQSGVTHCALASDFIDFLERRGLMTGFISSRDLAAAALYMPSHEALHHTFRTVISAVAAKHPRSQGGNLHVDFWREGKAYLASNAYLAWYYLNRKLSPAQSLFWIGIGICFPDEGRLGTDDPVRVPKDEPFFFVRITNEWRSKKASELLSRIPEGWVEIDEDHTALTTRVVSKFEANPDLRAGSLIAWAQEEVGRAVSCIPNYEDAPVENISDEVEGEEMGPDAI